MDDNCTLQELESNAASIIAEVRNSKKPLYVTQNGRAAAIIIDADTYQRNMLALEEFRRIFDKGSSIRPRTVKETPESSGAKVAWRCKACGFTVEADELPDGFVCPKCGQGKDMFERIEL